MGSPGGSIVKNLPANAGTTGDVGSIPGVGKIPWRRKWQPASVFLPGKSHGWLQSIGLQDSQTQFSNKTATTCIRS